MQGRDIYPDVFTYHLYKLQIRKFASISRLGDRVISEGLKFCPWAKHLSLHLKKAGSHSWLAHYSSERIQNHLKDPCIISTHKSDGIAKSWRTGQIIALEDIV